MFELPKHQESVDENDAEAESYFRKRIRLPRSDTRGQTVQIGAVLLFATIILAMTLYQVQIIPSQNHKIEFDHNQQVQDEMTSLRSTIHSIEDTNRDRQVSITLGTTYPERTLFVNPSPPIGSLRTVGTADPAVNVTIENATGVDDDLNDFWNTDTYRIHNFSTGAVVYEPTYTRYDDAPKTVYENSVLYNRFDGANLTLSNQLLVEGNTISIVALNGTFQKASRGTADVPVEALSASTRSVVVQGTDSDPLTLRVRTQLPNESWTSLLQGEYEENGGNITDQEYRNRSGEPNVLILRLDSGRYRLNLAKIGVGRNTDRPEKRYLVGVHGDDFVVGENETARVTVEVRDRFNNPVSEASVVARADGWLQNVTDGTHVTGDDGRATFVYRAEEIDGAAKPVRVNVSINDGDPSGAAFDPDTPENVTMQFTVENTDASGTVIGGGGGGGAYSVFWDEASSSSAALDCDAGNCTFDLSEANSTSLVIGTDPAINGTTVDFAWNHSSVGGLNPGSGVTNAVGENVTTFEANSTGTIQLYATSGGSVDRLNVTVVRPLIVELTYAPKQPKTNETVTFDGTNSGGANTNITSYDWGFGDNSTDSGAIVNHTYSDDGTYTVTLTVTDDDGSTNSTTRTITVQNRPPNASFTYNPSSPSTNETVTFDASGSNDPDGTITDYRWDLDGDNTVDATGETVSHSFTDEGNYSVTLNVTDDDGATDTDVANVTVTKEELHFTDLSIQDDSWWWFLIGRAVLSVDYTANDPDNTFKNVTVTFENIDTGNKETRSSTKPSDSPSYSAPLGTYGDTYEITVRMYEENGNVVFEETYTETAEGINDNGDII